MAIGISTIVDNLTGLKNVIALDLLLFIASKSLHCC